MPTAIFVLNRLSKGLPAFDDAWITSPSKAVVAFRRGVLDWLAVSGYTTRADIRPEVTPAGLAFLGQPYAIEWLKALNETPDAP